MNQNNDGGGSAGKRPGRRLTVVEWVTLVVLLVLVIVTYMSMPPTKIVDFFRATDWNMSSIYNALESYEADYGHFPAAAEEGDHEANNRALMAVLTNASNNVAVVRQNPEGRVYLQISGTEFRDPWGHPYHIKYTTNEMGAVIVGNVPVPERIAVWSDGPNGINEFGRGDDLRNWK